MTEPISPESPEARRRGFHGKSTRGDLLVTLMIEIPGSDAKLAEFVAGWTDQGNPRARLGV